MSRYDLTSAAGGSLHSPIVTVQAGGSVQRGLSAVGGVYGLYKHCGATNKRQSLATLTALPRTHMTEIDPLDDDNDGIEPTSKEEVKALRAELEVRCKAAKILLEDTEGYEEGQIACRVGIPSGRDKRWIYCWDDGDYKRILGIQFERFVFLHGLDAVCSYDAEEIEASVRTIGFATPRTISSRVFGVPPSEYVAGEPTPTLNLESPTGDQKVTISLGVPSHELVVLTGPGSQPRFSLKIKRDGLKQHDQALGILRRTADALFFQIDLLSDVPLNLVRDRRRIARRRAAKRSEIAPIAFPTHEYDTAPISLYWYARSAVGMPLLQFLAYYQVIEFYYPTYSQAEARRKIKAVLKDPAFRGDRDADLGRLLSAIHITRSGGVGDERSQLRATLFECLDADALRQFVSLDSDRMEFLSSKAKGFVDHKLPVANSTADLRGDVAERIYEIRCKIVHTKTDARNGEFDLLLPFSREAEQLSFDIELAQYVAQQVLIAASMPYQK